MVVQGGDDLVMRGRVEDFLHLLQERLPVELSRRHECVLSEQDVLTSQRRVEVLVQEVERLLISSFQNDFNRILHVNAHLVRFKVVLRFLVESVLGGLLLALETEDAPSRWQVSGLFGFSLFGCGIILQSCVTTGAAKCAATWTTVVALSFNRSNGGVLAVSVVILGHLFKLQL